MNFQMHAHLIIRSILILALALVIRTPVPAQSVESTRKDLTATKMNERCQAMMQEKQKMQEDMKAQDAALSDQITKMNNASEDKKMVQISDVLNLMAEQRISMNARKAKMQEEMLSHMMQHMQVPCRSAR